MFSQNDSARMVKWIQEISYSALSISRDIFAPKNSEKSPIAHP